MVKKNNNGILMLFYTNVFTNFDQNTEMSLFSPGGFFQNFFLEKFFKFILGFLRNFL